MANLKANYGYNKNWNISLRSLHRKLNNILDQISFKINSIMIMMA